MACRWKFLCSFSLFLIYDACNRKRDGNEAVSGRTIVYKNVRTNSWFYSLFVIDVKLDVDGKSVQIVQHYIREFNIKIIGIDIKYLLKFNNKVIHRWTFFSKIPPIGIVVKFSFSKSITNPYLNLAGLTKTK